MSWTERIIYWLCEIPEPFYGVVRRLGNVYVLLRNREKVIHPGAENPDKVFYVIRDMPATAGLGSWYDRVLGYLERAERKGWTPAIVPQEPSQPDSGDWTTYFSGIQVFSEIDVMRQKNVVNAIMQAAIYKRYNRRNIALRHRLGQSIRLSDAAWAYVAKRLQGAIGTTPSDLVGVMFRGTDYRTHGTYCPRGHARVPRIQTFCERVKRDLRQWQIADVAGEHLFVVTEEQEALDEIRTAFPKCRFVPKERFSNFKFENLLAYQRLPTTSPRENNFLYLLDILALSQCGFLIGGLNGCVLMALNLNGNQYKQVDILNTGVS